MGSKVTPLFTERQSPPVAPATKMVWGKSPTTSTSIIRPPAPGGPTERQVKVSRRDSARGAACCVAGGVPIVIAEVGGEAVKVMIANMADNVAA